MTSWPRDTASLRGRRSSARPRSPDTKLVNPSRRPRTLVPSRSARGETPGPAQGPKDPRSIIVMPRGRDSQSQDFLQRGNASSLLSRHSPEGGLAARHVRGPPARALRARSRSSGWSGLSGGEAINLLGRLHGTLDDTRRRELVGSRGESWGVAGLALGTLTDSMGEILAGNLRADELPRQFGDPEGISAAYLGTLTGWSPSSRPWRAFRPRSTRTPRNSAAPSTPALRRWSMSRLVPGAPVGRVAGVGAGPRGGVIATRLTAGTTAPDGSDVLATIPIQLPALWLVTGVGSLSRVFSPAGPPRAPWSSPRRWPWRAPRQGAAVATRRDLRQA